METLYLNINTHVSKQLSYTTRSSESSIVYHSLLKSKIVVGISLA
jgi:hypothetical protein